MPTDPDETLDPPMAIEEDHVDVLPADLDATSGVQYEFPNNSKRRLAAILYFAVGVICVAVGIGVDSPRVNGGITAVGIGLLVFAFYSFVVGAPTAVDEGEALVVAAALVGFAAGPASAQMVWLGWRSRPAWRVLMYSTEPQPLRRAVVVVDGLNGSVIEHLVEDNPEDWSAL